MPHVARLSNRVLSKAIASGGGQEFSAPAEWITTQYGSGWPIAPVSAPKDVELPRAIDYPISVNATLTPRTGYGLMPFAALLEAYENVTEVRTPVELICREMGSFVPRLIDDDGNDVSDHDYAWLCEKPDGETPFGPWMARMIKSMKIYDAPAVYMDTSHGKTTGLHFIDGSTLFVIVDEFGKVPKAEPLNVYLTRTAAQNARSSSSKPSSASKATTGESDTGWPVGPSTLDALVSRLIQRQNDGEDIPERMPAYTQVIKGTPFSWWSADQVWYMPKSPRINSPYGESFIEIAWSWLMIVVNITAFELGHYRTGSMPEGFVTIPKSEYSDQNALLALELLYNSRMSSNPATERMRLRFFPDGTKYIPTKKPDFPDRLYNQAWKNILHAIGVPPSELGDIPGGGLGGKGFKEGSLSDLSRNTLNPVRQALAEPFNHALQRDGVRDVKFELGYPMDEIDPDKQKQGVYDGMAHGTLSLNDALGELNMNPVGDPDDRGNIANKHLIVAGSAIYVVEDMKSQNGMAIPTFTGKPGGNTGGTPVGPETAAQQAGAVHTSEDHKTIEKIIRHVLDSGTLDGKFYSIPKLSLEKEIQPLLLSAPLTEETPGPPDYTPVGHDLLGAEVEERRRRETPILPVDKDADNARPAGVSHMSQWYQIAIEKETKKHPDLRPDEIEAIVRANLREKFDYYGKPNWASHLAPHQVGKMGTTEQFTAGVKEEQSEHPQLSLSEIEQLVIDHLNKDPNYYRVGKIITASELRKHCGVCPEDDDYFDAPISREVGIDFPADAHANSVEIVAMVPDGLPPKAALWKPEGAEMPELQDYIGGPQYVREEAAYLLDRSLGFYLVPVAYVTEADGEVGAAIYYTASAQKPYEDVRQYDAVWVERAAVLDYIMSQQDRGPLHNYLTHPDDPKRPIIIDNGLGFPVDTNKFCVSPFCNAMINQPLSSDTLKRIAMLLGDSSTYSDIKSLVGDDATKKAWLCAKRLFDEKMITSYTSDQSYTEGTGDGETPLTSEGSSS